MNWPALFDFRATAVLQLIGLGLEVFAYLLWMRRSYPYREAMRSLLIAIPAFVIWGLEVQVVFHWAEALKPYRLFYLDPNEPWVWMAAFALAELHFYLTHVLEHRVSWFWADHQVHHSSTQLNIFDGNRLGWTVLFAGGFNTLFLPLVLLGFDGGQLIGFSGTILIYQFFLHTQTVPKLGFLEYFLNTPSNHRVHHASNPEYVDRNYGGITVVFDRLFGTYATESAATPLRFGLSERDTLRDSFWLLPFRGWIHLARVMRGSHSPQLALMTLLKPPGGAPKNPPSGPRSEVRASA